VTAEKDGSIETTEGSEIYLKVFTPYTMSTDEMVLTLNTTQVQQYSQYQFVIGLDIPLQSGCIFEF
jgi:hypothetical protein